MSMQKNVVLKKARPEVAVAVNDCTGRDEMNLAEFPLALLAERNKNGAITFVRERTLTMPDGSTLQQSWQVTGAPKYGLPQPLDEDVLLGLLKIAADNGFESPTVHFTQMSLLNLLCWRNQGYYFDRLEQSLARLKTTSILATNAFWNNVTKMYQTRHFGVIDSYELWQRRPGTGCSRPIALSSNWARFSQEFFSSIQAGYLKPLDLAFYFSLKCSVSKRLFRFLDKKRYKKDEFSINLQRLASVHLGLGESTCRYTSWIQRELNRAHRELVARDFLQSAEYSLSRNGMPKVTYMFNKRPSRMEQLSLPAPPVEAPVVDEKQNLLRRLLERNVSPSVARELVECHSIEVVDEKIDVFDHLNNTVSGRPMQNPGGFLAQAIRNGWNITPPGYVPRAVRKEKARASVHEQQQKQQHADHQAQEAQAIEAARAVLSKDALAELREQAFRRAQDQLGNSYRLKRESRIVDAFVNGILQERLAART